MSQQNLQPVINFPQLPVFPGYENILKPVLFLSLTTGKYKLFDQLVELTAGKNYESTAGFFSQLRERVGRSDAGEHLLIDITPKDIALHLGRMYKYDVFNLRRPLPSQLDDVNYFRSVAAVAINNYKEPV